MGRKFSNNIINDIKSNKCTKLILKDDQLGDEEIKRLSDLIKNNSSVTEMDISNNQIGKHGLECLETALNTNTTLIKLTLTGNKPNQTLTAKKKELIKSVGNKVGLVETTEAMDASMLITSMMQHTKFNEKICMLTRLIKTFDNDNLSSYYCCLSAKDANNSDQQQLITSINVTLMHEQRKQIETLFAVNAFNQAKEYIDKIDLSNLAELNFEIYMLLKYKIYLLIKTKDYAGASQYCNYYEKLLKNHFELTENVDQKKQIKLNIITTKIETLVCYFQCCIYFAKNDFTQLSAFAEQGLKLESALYFLSFKARAQFFQKQDRDSVLTCNEIIDPYTKESLLSINTNKKNLPAYLIDAYIIKASAMHRLGESKDALETKKQALEIFSNNFSIKIKKIYILCAVDLVSAEETIKELSKDLNGTTNLEYLTCKAWYSYIKKDFTTASDLLEQVLTIDPQWAPALSHKIDLLLEQKEYNKAEEAINKLKEINSFDINANVKICEIRKQELIEAIYQKEEKTFDRIIETFSLLQLDEPDTITGMCPIHYAARNGFFYGVKALIDKNVSNVNKTDRDGQTALHKLINKETKLLLMSSERIIKLENVPDNDTILLQKDVSIASKISTLLSESPLIAYWIEDNQLKSKKFPSEELCLKEPLFFPEKDEGPQLVTTKNLFHKIIELSGYIPLNIKAINYLVKKKANINAKDKLGNTPLHYAVVAEDFPTIICLIKNKANILLTNAKGRSSIDLAVKAGHVNIVQLLLKRISLSNNKEILLSFLEVAIEYGQISTFSSLLNYLYSLKLRNSVLLDLLKKKNKNADMIIHTIAKVGNSEIMNIYLLFISQSGLNLLDIINDQNTNGHTALYFACIRRQTQLINCILSNNVATVEETLLDLKKNNGDMIKDLFAQFLVQKFIEQKIDKKILLEIQLLEPSLQNNKTINIKELLTRCTDLTQFLSNINNLPISETIIKQFTNKILVMINQKKNEPGFERHKPAYQQETLQQAVNMVAKNVIEVQQTVSVEKKSNYFNDNEYNMLKLKAFCLAIQQGIRYSFYVSLALNNGKVNRAPDWLDNITNVEQAISPAIAEKIGSTSGAAILVGINIVGTLIKLLRDKNAKAEAQYFIEAFGRAGGDEIDERKLLKLARQLTQRYSDQITELTLSTSFENSLLISNPHKDDGVIVFARCIVARISANVWKNKNVYFDTYKDRISDAVNQVANIFRTEPGYRRREKIPLYNRCVLALLQENEHHDSTVNRTDQGKPEYKAGEILSFTGIKCFSNESMEYFIRENFTLPDIYGFCHCTKEELTYRSDFVRSISQADPFDDKKMQNFIYDFASENSKVEIIDEIFNANYPKVKINLSS